jgi:cytochrome c oxidase cbb3-type subunit I/II
MLEPVSISPGSIMPRYPWLFEQGIDLDATAGKISALRRLGVPYQNRYEEIANEDLMRQAGNIANNLKTDGIEVSQELEIVAMIAYLQRLGTDIKVKTASGN